MSINIHKPSRNYDVTVWFKGQATTQSQQNGICFMSPFWHLAFGSDS